MESKHCRNCGLEFFRKVYMHNKTWAVTEFCSVKCAAVHRAGLKKTATIIVKCHACGETIPREDRRADRYQKLTSCSEKCRKILQRRGAELADTGIEKAVLPLVERIPAHLAGMLAQRNLRGSICAGMECAI